MTDLCRCGAEPTVTLGVHGYCPTCYTQFVATFDPSVWNMGGTWTLDGIIRPDHGPQHANCRCIACDATAVAIVGTPCDYCRTSLERLTEWQAELVQQPPTVDPDDIRRPDAVRAWAERLAVAVKAELITDYQARAVLRQEWTT